jgi:hypothetical protein
LAGEQIQILDLVCFFLSLAQRVQLEPVLARASHAEELGLDIRPIQYIRGVDRASRISV